MTMETWNVGPHQVCREAENYMVYRFARGPVTQEHLAAMAEIERPFWDCGHLYILTILDAEMSVLPGTLSFAVKSLRDSPPRTGAFVVRGFILRTSMEFMLRALRKLGTGANSRFFEDEASARVWIEERRAARAGA